MLAVISGLSHSVIRSITYEILTSLGSDIGLKFPETRTNSRWPQHAWKGREVVAVELCSVQPEYILFGCIDIRSDSKPNSEGLRF